MRAAGEHHAEQAAGEPEQHHLQHIGRQHLAGAAPRHLRIATLRIFWRTNTRVTLQTPMPPSTTMMKPTRLR